MSKLVTKRRCGKMGKRAFTLIELMIVVAIVGILAVLGVVGYRKLILAAHTSEATHMVQSIRVAEETYHAEAQAYVATSTDAMSNFFPNASPSNVMTPWVPPTTGCSASSPSTGCWAILPVHVDGPVMYGYTTSAGAAGSTPNTVKLTNPSQTLTGPTSASPTDWYWITAEGNPAGYPAGSPFSWVVGNSFTTELFVLDQ